MRLRYKISALFLLLIIPTLVLSLYSTTNVFLKDKKRYLMELNSLTAPNLSSTISHKLIHLENQLRSFDLVLDRTLQNSQSTVLLQDTFENISGIQFLEIYDEKGLVAKLGTPNKGFSSQSIPLASKGRFLTGNLKSHLFSTKLDNRHYIVQLSPTYLSSIVNIPNAAALSIRTDSGVSLAENGTAIHKLSTKDLRKLFSISKKNNLQKVTAKELSLESNQTHLVAISPIPNVQGAFLMMQIPTSKALDAMKGAFFELLPSILVLVLLAIGLGLISATRLAKPIEQLRQATSKIASGHWQIDLKPHSNDELGSLTESFSTMGGELEKREKDLRQAHEELLRSEKLALMGTFSAGIAHEVKNPLGSISGYAQLLRRKTPDPDTLKKYIGFIQEETLRASKIVSDLLVFARQKPPALKSQDIVATIDNLFQKHQLLAKENGVYFYVELSVPTLYLNVDPDQLYQVISNIVMNAFHACKEKPKSKVTLQLDQEDDNFAAIKIIDEGPGMSPDIQKRIFEPFFSTKKSGSGTGLGLALCQEIIRQHHGEILVDSEIGKGSTFTIKLPLEFQQKLAA